MTAHFSTWDWIGFAAACWLTLDGVLLTIWVAIAEHRRLQAARRRRRRGGNIFGDHPAGQFPRGAP